LSQGVGIGVAIPKKENSEGKIVYEMISVANLNPPEAAKLEIKFAKKAKKKENK
jgi:hypothetical protein